MFPSQLPHSNKPKDDDPSTTCSDTLPCESSCPSCQRYRRMLLETIEVLIQTKSAFRSKTLATLRHQIESILKHPLEAGPHP